MSSDPSPASGGNSSSSSSSSSGENNGGAFDRTVQFVVFSGIALSVIKSLNPLNRRRNIQTDQSPLAPPPPPPPHTVTELTHSSAQTQTKPITDNTPFPPPSPPIATNDSVANVNGAEKALPSPVSPILQPITKLDAQPTPLTESIQPTGEIIPPPTLPVQPVAITAAKVNGAEAQPPPPLTEPTKPVQETIPDSPLPSQPITQKPNGNKNGPVASHRTVEITAGDTLWGLSRKYGVSVDAIKEANGLSGNIIHVGKKLIIP